MRATSACRAPPRRPPKAWTASSISRESRARPAARPRRSSPRTSSAPMRMFEAARKAGVRRFIFASSNHVIGFYRADRPVGTRRAAAARRPLRRQQGVRRGHGPALCRQARHGGRSLAHRRFPRAAWQRARARRLDQPPRHGAARAALRRGAAVPFPRALRRLGKPRARWVGDAAARAHIGYAPQDDAEVFAAELAAKPAPGARYAALVPRRQRVRARVHRRPAADRLAEDILGQQRRDGDVRHVDHVAHPQVHRHAADDVGLLARPAALLRAARSCRSPRCARRA